MDEVLIAPCGMNCAICSAYLAFKNDIKSKGIRMPYCTGCRPRNKKCAFLKKKCELLIGDKIQFCYECDDFPCKRLQSIDKRYREHYHMSMVDNLKYLKEYGIKRFLINQDIIWKCPDCGGIICCHNGICFNCGFYKLKEKKKLYRWED